MDIQENASLASHNTLALSQSARYFSQVGSIESLQKSLQFAAEQSIPYIVIGEGSNLVWTSDFSGLVIRNCIKGIEVLAESDSCITVKIGAGENWHQLVVHCLTQQWYGLENLALIPGTVGAAPVQNIGAYGVELCNFLQEVEAWDCQLGEVVTLSCQNCDFSYRNSIFKTNPDRYIILSVTLLLHRQPKLNISYQSLSDYLKIQQEQGQLTDTLTPHNIFDAVVAIRSAKLPDPNLLPNVGSFFKNPIVSEQQFYELHKQFPDMVNYPDKAGVKLAAAWLIDKAGWKGQQHGNVGMHKEQALVMVNYGNATGEEVLELANRIKKDIQQRYGVALEIEPVTI